MGTWGGQGDEKLERAGGWEPGEDRGMGSWGGQGDRNLGRAGGWEPALGMGIWRGIGRLGTRDNRGSRGRKGRMWEV